MLRASKDLEQFTLCATDRALGYVKDFLFDDQAWVLRYLVVDVGVWLTSRHVLISLNSIGDPDWDNKVLPVRITKEQIRNGPLIDIHRPISRADESRHCEHYGHPIYWGGGDTPERNRPSRTPSDAAPTDGLLAPERPAEVHLRGCNAVQRCRVHASGSEIGQIQGFLIDECSWAIRYCILNTSRWRVGPPLLLAPEWIGDINWAEGQILIDVPLQAVKDSPRFNAAAPLLRHDEMRIYAHYGRSGYWMDAGHGALTRIVACR